MTAPSNHPTATEIETAIRGMNIYPPGSTLAKWSARHIEDRRLLDGIDGSLEERIMRCMNLTRSADGRVLCTSETGGIGSR